jgi:hypothetical protein
MTVTAISSLKKKSPFAKIGVIVPPNKTLDLIENQIIHALGDDVSNIVFKSGKTHFDNWNPTQVCVEFNFQNICSIN